MNIKGLLPLGSSGIAHSGIVDKITEIESTAIEALKSKKEADFVKKNQYSALQGAIDQFGSSLDSLKSEKGFQKLKLDSSHPELISAEIGEGVGVGRYEFEVTNIAKPDRHLSFGFENLNEPVGFGFMEIEKEAGGAFEVKIDPGANLKDVAEQINASKNGVKAQILNTGISEEPFRLIVSSEKTGLPSKINIDPDTTFLDFKNSTPAQNLKMKFEGVEIERPENKFDDLIKGIKFDVKQASPGTMVQVNVGRDMDQTLAGIKNFTEQYNKIVDQTHSSKDVKNLGQDASAKQVMRSLRSEISNVRSPDVKFQTLADVGITSDPKTGGLTLNEEKLKSALNENYDAVAKIFTKSESSTGIAERMSQTIKNIQDGSAGPLKARVKTLDESIKKQDLNIEQQTEKLAKKKEHLQGVFSKLDARVESMNHQQSFIQTQMGGSKKPNEN